MAKKQMVNIGQRIKSLREASGYMEQKEFAKKIGVSAASLWNYEMNISEPSLATVVRISEVLGVSIDTIINGTTETAEELIETKTGLSADSVRILKRINKLCEDREIPNPINSLVSKPEFQDCITELICMTIILLNDTQGTTDESIGKLVHKLNVSHLLNGGELDNYQGVFYEIARLHSEDAKAAIGKAIDKVRMGVWNNGTR